MIELPFRYWIHQNYVPTQLCRAAMAEWPAAGWPGWLEYEGERGDKFATKSPEQLTPACREIVRMLAHAPIEDWLGERDAFPDLGLHGAGMSMILPGGRLPLHRDADHRKSAGWQRVASVMAYVSECKGGELVLGHPDGLQIALKPSPGTVAAFACTDQAWHEVTEVTSGVRNSVSVFFWRLAVDGQSNTRSRAEFCDIRGKRK